MLGAVHRRTAHGWHCIVLFCTEDNWPLSSRSCPHLEQLNLFPDDIDISQSPKSVVPYQTSSLKATLNTEQEQAMPNSLLREDLRLTSFNHVLSLPCENTSVLLWLIAGILKSTGICSKGSGCHQLVQTALLAPQSNPLQRGPCNLSCPPRGGCGQVHHLDMKSLCQATADLLNASEEG